MHNQKYGDTTVKPVHNCGQTKTVRIPKPSISDKLTGTEQYLPLLDTNL